MNEKTLLMKVMDRIKKETSWNEFICSLTKEEFREYLNSENHYTCRAEEFIDCEKFYYRLCEENPDKDVHVYIDKNFQGITERTKCMFIFRNGSIYKTFTCYYHKDRDRYEVSTDLYSTNVNAFGIDDFKKQLLCAVEKYPEFFMSKKDDIFSVLRFHRDGIVKLF